MSSPEPDWIEIVYALPERQWVRRLGFREGLCALEAVRESGLLAQVRAEDSEPLVLGIYGKVIAQDRQLQPGDRVEIYRRLRNDPRESRRQRASQGRMAGRAGR
jgi:hypothetical protein